MGRYAYLTTHQLSNPEINCPLPNRKEHRSDSRHSNKLPIFLILIGLVLLGTAGWPVVEWQLIQAYDVTEGTLIKPVIDLIGKEGSGQSAHRPSQFGQLLLPPDLGTAEKPPAPLGGFDKRLYITDFTISIPKLRIDRVLVKVDSESFDQWLAHYPGSALPGEEGNVFISGHSVLPQFYNPRDYKTIFSTIHTLEPGDEILVEVGGVEYRYLVKSKRVVDPQEVSVIKPPAPGRFLSLLTCNPPGTYFKRLIVLAELAI